MPVQLCPKQCANYKLIFKTAVVTSAAAAAASNLVVIEVRGTPGKYGGT